MNGTSRHVKSYSLCLGPEANREQQTQVTGVAPGGLLGQGGIPPSPSMFQPPALPHPTWQGLFTSWKFGATQCQGGELCCRGLQDRVRWPLRLWPSWVASAGGSGLTRWAPELGTIC